MLENYIQLKKEVSGSEKELKTLVLKGKQEIETLEKSISECQSSLEKGNGFFQILASEYQTKLEETQVSVLKGITEKKSVLEKSKRELFNLLEKNSYLSSFENYTKVIPFEEFSASLLTLVKAHQNKKISFEILEKAKKESLKFKEIELNSKKYMVKDNRTNYADMIIFNQNNQILFVKRNKDEEFEPGKYALPGGHVEPAESPLLAAIREVEEEIGIKLDIKLVSPSGIYENTEVLINYFCTKVDDPFLNMVLEERELQQYEWVDLEKIGELDLLMNLKENFENVIEIPTTLLTNQVGSQEIAAFYGLPINNVPGTGYPL